MKNTFKEEDKTKLVEFLNMVAIKAQFNVNTQEIIKYHKLLSFMQQELLPKIDAHILEVVAVHEAEESGE